MWPEMLTVLHTPHCLRILRIPPSLVRDTEGRQCGLASPVRPTPGGEALTQKATGTMLAKASGREWHYSGADLRQAEDSQ